MLAATIVTTTPVTSAASEDRKQWRNNEVSINLLYVYRIFSIQSSQIHNTFTFSLAFAQDISRTQIVELRVETNHHLAFLDHVFSVVGTPTSLNMATKKLYP